MSAQEHPPEPLEIQAWRPDQAACPEAFAPPAGERPARFRPRDEAQWDWAFRRNPGGTRLHLARRGGALVACHGGLPLRALVYGGVRHCVSLFDPVLAPGERARGTAEALARAFQEAHCGMDQDLLHYGWPEGEDRALAKGPLGHEILGASTLLVRALAPGPVTPGPGVEELARFGDEVGALHARCAQAWLASAVRDAAFLNWRFAENPFARYRLLAVRSGGELRGVAVYRSGAQLFPGLGLVMDWLVTPEDAEAAEALLEALCACARADRAVALAGSFPEWSPWSLHFQERGFLHHPSEHLRFVHSSIGRLDMVWLRDNWWTTLADAMLL